MKLDMDDQGEVIRFLLEGDLDSEAAEEARERFFQATRSPARTVVIDATGLRFLDSSGIGALVYLHRHLAEDGRRLVMVGLTGQPLKLLRMIGFDREVEIAEGHAGSGN